MADIKIGERGSARGPRGPEGPRGHRGATGPTGIVSAVVFRPGDPRGSHDTVFVTWGEVYAALQAVAGDGPVDLQFDDRFSSPCHIPAGTWSMDDVRWTGVQRDETVFVFVELDDGASIVMPSNTSLSIYGNGLAITSNRKGPIAPFSNITVVCDGVNVKFFNTDPAALPMFEVGPGNFRLLVFGGDNVRGGLGDAGAPLPAPIFDVKGGNCLIGGGAGLIGNNAFTDTVGGGSVLIGVFTNAFVGDSQNEWSFPALIAGGGTLSFFTTMFNRWLVDPLVKGSPVTPALSPYGAAYNELVLVNTTTGPVTVNAPTAAPAIGERFTVKDVGASANVNNITVAPAGTNTVESPIIATASGSKTWASDGKGHWFLVAQV